LLEKWRKISYDENYKKNINDPNYGDALQCQFIVKNTTAPSNHFIKNAEIEGIKIYTESSNDYMYMMFRKAGSSFRFKIYKYQI
jgi:hypothetical protein